MGNIPSITGIIRITCIIRIPLAGADGNDACDAGAGGGGTGGKDVRGEGGQGDNSKGTQIRKQACYIGSLISSLRR